MEDAGDQRQRAFAELAAVAAGMEAGEPDAARAAGERLRERLIACPEGPDLAGFSLMASDAALGLLAGGEAADALSLCDAVLGRCGEATQGDRAAAAAGARFLAAQASGRLGDAVRSRRELDALSAMGEAALAGLERLAGRLAGAGAAPAWHAQLAAVSVAVLWRSGRVTEARAFARETAATFDRLGETDLAAGLRALEAELSG